MLTCFLCVVNDGFALKYSFLCIGKRLETFYVKVIFDWTQICEKLRNDTILNV